MKVKIGPYRDWIGPYQISEMLMFWCDKHNDLRVHKFGTWLAEDKNGENSWLMNFCNWIHSKKNRTVKIHIDNFDHWNAHNTASMILLPLFSKLKKHKQGSGYIDDEDVPEHLRSTAADAWEGISEEQKSCMHSDKHLHARYEWFLDEVLWALEQDQPDCNWEDQYWITHPEIDFSKNPEDEGKSFIPVRWKVEGKCDWDARALHQKRINNGFRMMGKYWQTLWD